MQWDPSDELNKVHRELDKAFNSFMKSPLIKKGKEAFNLRSPVSDVYEKGNELVVRIELPGIEKEDIHINITDNEIEVKSRKKRSIERKKKGFYSYESSAQQFYKKMSLPAVVDSSKAKASYKNGVLVVRIPKKKVKKKKKKLVLR